MFIVFSSGSSRIRPNQPTPFFCVRCFGSTQGARMGFRVVAWRSGPKKQALEHETHFARYFEQQIKEGGNAQMIDKCKKRFFKALNPHAGDVQMHVPHDQTNFLGHYELMTVCRDCVAATQGNQCFFQVTPPPPRTFVFWPFSKG